MTTGSDRMKYSQLESRTAYKEFYEAQGTRYGNHHLTEDFPRVKFILDRLRPTDVVLEMGCQTGGITRLIAPYARFVTANELSDTYRARAQEILTDIPHVALIGGFAEDLFGSFNVVIAMELLEHVADADALCEAVTACMKTDGLALFSVPHGYTDTLGEHVREFTEQSFRELLDRHFSTVEITDAGEWYLAEARL